MPDVVVTCPKSFGLETWIAEGDPAGDRWSGQLWDFYLGGARPDIREGERVYVVYNNVLRGYAPLVRLDEHGGNRYSLVRGGGAVAVTIPEDVRGFRGFRYRWWTRGLEIPFPQWKDPNASWRDVVTVGVDPAASGGDRGVEAVWDRAEDGERRLMRAREL